MDQRQKRILESVEHLRWSFFAEIVNGLNQLTNFAKTLHRICMTGF